MNFSKKKHRVRHIKRFAVISRIMVKHGLGEILDRIFDRDDVGAKVVDEKPVFTRTVYPSPRRIRRVFEELGPTFVKLGQLMSIRADMIPAEYLEEFKKLQDHVPPVSFSEIQAVIEKELKHPISELFISIEEESLAGASVAQVHAAELAEGEMVVVKVIRPGIDKKIREDIRLMYYFAEKLETAFEVGQVIGFVNLVKEFERSIFRELDMYIEAGNTEGFWRNFKDSRKLYIPKVYWEYTSKSILVMVKIARQAAQKNRAMVIGTTGLSQENLQELASLCNNFPCVQAPNMAVGVNVLFKLAAKVASILGNDYDMEIVEAHHRMKKDAPSGTAMKLGEMMAQAVGRNLDEDGVFSRHGIIGERTDKEIGLQTIRGGDIVGEHTVYFAGAGERLELTHRAHSRDNFARGAALAAAWVVKQPNGLYNMFDVLGLQDL